MSLESNPSNNDLTVNEIDKILSAPDESEQKEDLLKDEKPAEKEEVPLEEQEEEVPENLELATPVRRKEILAKYPNLFKDFPYLESAYYREQQFAELFPTPDDAREILERNETFQKFESDLLSGKTDTTLQAIKEADKDAFGRLVDDYLPALARADQGAYYNVIGNVIKQTVISMVNEAQRLNNEDLKSAAALLNQFVFGSSNFSAPQRYGPDSRPNEESKKISEERSQLVRERFENTRDELSGKVDNILKSTISQNIDPKSSMTDYVKRNATREAIEELDRMIAEDSRFQSFKDKLWEKAFQANFSKSSVDAIRSAYLGKAKSLLPQVIQKARNDALKGTGKRVSSAPQKEEKQSEPRTKLESKQIPRKMKTLDYLMQD